MVRWTPAYDAVVARAYLSTRLALVTRMLVSAIAADASTVRTHNQQLHRLLYGAIGVGLKQARCGLGVCEVRARCGGAWMFWHAMLFAPCSFVMIWVVGGVWVSSVEQGVGAHVLARGRR